jgi:hypothetical protein
MNKWVCVTKDWNHFTYGKTYEGEQLGSLLDVEDDIGDRPMPCLYGVESVIPMMNTTYYGPPTKKIYYFLTLEEWRNKQINKVIDEI